MLVNISKRKERRTQYAKVQIQYSKNRRKCIKKILEWTTETRQPLRRLMEPYWLRVFTQDSNQAQVFNVTEDVKTDFWKSITIEEIEKYMIKGKSAPGPDGLTVKSYARILKGILLFLFNIILWIERLPKSLLASRTIFILKKRHEEEPEKYSPITISSVLIRDLHRISAVRLENAIQIDERQRVFQTHIDG